MFRRYSVISIICCLCGALIFMAPDVTGQDAGESVVIVHTETGESGYGVAWGTADQIVTVLHLVAGKSTILVQQKNKKSEADIIQINKGADLALLKLRKSLDITPLEIYQGDPPTGIPLNFWEAKRNSTRVNNRSITLNSRKGAVPLSQLDKRISQNQQTLATFANNLCSDAGTTYPSLNMSVFKFVDKSVKKSHSGSPITYNGQIVALVDGGTVIAAKPVVWATNAAEYFTNLSANSPFPGQTCSTKNLYSGFREDNPLLCIDPDDGDTLAVLNPEFRVSFGDIYGTIFESDQQAIEYILELEQILENDLKNTDANFAAVTLDDLHKDSLDVYEDFRTGAIIVVPARTEPEFTTFDDLGFQAEVKAEKWEGIEMVIQVKRCGDELESRKAIEWFENYILTAGGENKERWEIDATYGEITDSLADKSEPYYESDLLYTKKADGEFDNDNGIMFALLTVDNYDFLGTSVTNYGNLFDLPKHKRIQYYIMQICVTLSGFGFY